jgi:hypothetical protein
MSDIVERLRKWCHAVNAASAQDIMDEAADEIERLRSGGACPHVRDDDADTAAEAAREIERLRLTDAEREAVERAAFVSDQAGLEKSAVTLRKLLERIK